MADLPPRESMEFDVVIVGAGPAGLAAAIRLKQLSPDITVVVLEKGSEVGAHILSGAVIDPDRPRPAAPRLARGDGHVRSRRRSPTTVSIARPRRRAPRCRISSMPPLMSNHGNYIVSLGNVCRWLASKAEALGVEIYPGFAAAEVLYDENGAVAASPPATWASASDGKPKDGFTPRHGAARQVHADRRGRARLARQAADRAASSSTRDREPQKFGIGLKELWQVAPEKHQPGPRAAHLRLAARQCAPAAARSSTTSTTIWSSVGFVVHLNYKNPYLSPVRGVPALQDASRDPRHASRAASASPTARAPSPRAAGSRCRSSPSRAAR